MEISVQLTSREESGSSASRRLRKEGRIPAVVYGLAEGKSLLGSLDATSFKKSMRKEALQSSVLSLVVDDDRKINVLLRELQYHPYRREILHVDFQQVHADEEISLTVPIVFINQDIAPGVKLNGGVFTTIENEVGIVCLPKNIPEHIEIDVANLTLGSSVHLSDVPALPGVNFEAIVRGEDPALAIISSVSEEEPATQATAVDPAAEVAPPTDTKS